jgi:geranylgeranyl pyrophosphate synthase
MSYDISSHSLALARDRFSSEFDVEWSRVLSNVNCWQAQLLCGHRLRPHISFWGYLAALQPYQYVDDDYTKIARISVSIELLHKASLLFDDWIDSDTARHGSPTFHVQYSPQLAVVFGLHLVGIAARRIKEILPPDKVSIVLYNHCMDEILDTIYSMSQGALSELRLTHEELFDLEKIKEIARLETSEIIGNSIQLGYIIGGAPNEQTCVLLKHIGNQCGYLFQTMNDLEALGNSHGNAQHKGNVNFDIDCRRKNIAIATLYQIAKRNDRVKITSSIGTDIVILAKRYGLVEFILHDMENVFKKMTSDIESLIKYGVSIEWTKGFLEFIYHVHDEAVHRLSV